MVVMVVLVVLIIAVVVVVVVVVVVAVSCDYTTTRETRVAKQDTYNCLHRDFDTAGLAKRFPSHHPKPPVNCPMSPPRECCGNEFLGGGFKYFLFSRLFGEDSHFD